MAKEFSSMPEDAGMEIERFGEALAPEKKPPEARLDELRRQLQEARIDQEADPIKQEISQLEKQIEESGQPAAPQEQEREIELEIEETAEQKAEREKQNRAKLQSDARVKGKALAILFGKKDKNGKRVLGDETLVRAASRVAEDVRALAATLGLEAEADQTFIKAVREVANPADAADIESLLRTAGVKGESKTEVKE